jgi:hypothetical protein
MNGQELRAPAVTRRASRIAFCALFVLAGSVGVSQSEPISLSPARTLGDKVNVEVTLQVGGELILSLPSGDVLKGKEELQRIPMNVNAKLLYDEQVTADRQDTTGTKQSVRTYHTAKALVEVEKGNQQPALSIENRAILVAADGNALSFASLNSSLTREELDLIEVPANSLLIDDLLPSELVEVGASWEHSADTLAALLGLDAVSMADARSMLAELDATQDIAKISLAGTVHGAVGGVATEIELKAKYNFDQKLRRITFLAILIKEKRSIGHIGPGLDIVAKQVVRIRPVPESETLANAVRAAKNVNTQTANAALKFESPHNRFRLFHSPSWYVTSDDKKLTVFRMVDRGELLAQCNVTMLDPSARPTLTLADFQNDIERTLDKRFGQFVSAKEETDTAGRRVYRVVVQGSVSDLPIQWIYYLFETQPGQRLSIAFTLEQSLTERFADADRHFLSSLEILPAQTAATGTPTPAQR